MEYIILPIKSDWFFYESLDKNPHYNDHGHEQRYTHAKWPTNGFPTTIHQDLLANRLIPDPFHGKNEEAVQWVGDRDWTYFTYFRCPNIPRGPAGVDAKADLVFEGLDTFAEVRLNGRVILETSNMFTPERVRVGHLLRLGQNLLQITFRSASRIGMELVRSDPKAGVNYLCSNGDISRLPSRKAQYHWGWDWGPKLLTCGPWKPINLEIYNGRIADAFVETRLSEDLSVATVTAHVAMEGNVAKATFQLFPDDLSHDPILVEIAYFQPGTAHASCDFTIQDPKLWYPKGYGKQTLYYLRTILFVKDQNVAENLQSFGLRRVELVQDPLEGAPGKSFYFRINNIPIFCGGSNWIPADSFLPRMTQQKYYKWVKLAADGHQCMLRVWGGGIYENKYFYHACDKLGILVWQDFMFACGNYPGTADFLESVRKEARANIKLLRRHPCIVIWAGNNEDYQIAEDAGFTYDTNDKDPENWLRSNFPARYIYEKLLKDLCEELVPGTPYHFGSPWSPSGKSSDPTVGDIHQWNVWHGSQEKYQNWDKLGGRFVSEFGMQACPNLRTLESFTSSDSDRRPSSSVMDFHNKATGHERRLACYLAENIPLDCSTDVKFMYGTQLVQADCLATAYRDWRREWREKPSRAFCGGALVWQLNDCWPGISWSICDYYLRPKGAYFAIKRELQPMTIGIKRRKSGGKMFGADMGGESQLKFEIWGSSFLLEPQTLDFIVKTWVAETGELLFSETVAKGFTLLPNQTTELKVFDIHEITSSSEMSPKDTPEVVVAAYLTSNGALVSRCASWPEPLKVLDLSHLRLPFLRLLKGQLQIAARSLYKGLLLLCDDSGISLSNNMIDLLPGEVHDVEVKGLDPGQDLKLSVHFLGCMEGIRTTVPYG